MRTATLSADGTTIENIIEAETLDAIPGVTLIEIANNVGIGWTTSDGGQTWQPPPPPPPSPQQTSREQLIEMMAQIPQLSTQITSDAKLWQNTGAGSTLGQNHIDSMVRIINGFQTVMEALIHFGVATNVLPPPSS